MKTWTVHLRESGAPVLVPEAFSWGAFFFGWVWLLAYRAWLPAVLLLAGSIVLLLLAPLGAKPLVALGIAMLQGLHGNDLRRWSLERGGYALGHVVAARDTDGAWLRLLDRRPDLVTASLA